MNKKSSWFVGLFMLGWGLGGIRGRHSDLFVYIWFLAALGHIIRGWSWRRNPSTKEKPMT